MGSVLEGGSAARLAHHGSGQGSEARGDPAAGRQQERTLARARRATISSRLAKAEPPSCGDSAWCTCGQGRVGGRGGCVDGTQREMLFADGWPGKAGMSPLQPLWESADPESVCTSTATCLEHDGGLLGQRGEHLFVGGGGAGQHVLALLGVGHHLREAVGGGPCSLGPEVPHHTPCGSQGQCCWKQAHVREAPAAGLLHESHAPNSFSGRPQQPGLSTIPGQPGLGSHLHHLLVGEVQGEGLEGAKALAAPAGLLVGGTLLGVHHA